MPVERPLTISLGEILWDCLPTGKLLGGAPANVGWHAKQLGADARVVSAVGDDELGHEILRRLDEMGLGHETVEVIKDKPTSTVDAVLDAHGVPTYTIHKDVAWDVMPATAKAINLAKTAKAINFGSLYQRSGNGRKVTRAILLATPADCLRVFDINLRPPFVYPDVIKDTLELTTVVKLNHEELAYLANHFSWPDDPRSALEELRKNYPNIKHAVVTRGPDGVWWMSADGFYSCPGKKVKVVDTIGAGDSFTAVIIMGLLAGRPVDRIMEAALTVAGFVCSQPGATPVLPPELAGILN